MGDFNNMRSTGCLLPTLLLFTAHHVFLIHGQLIACIPWMESKTISCNCSDNRIVFVDDAYVKKTTTNYGCSPSNDTECSRSNNVTEYVRTTCFNKTSCSVTFPYQWFSCPGYQGSLYVFIRHRCQPVFDVDGKEPLPVAVIGGERKEEESGIIVMINSPHYPRWIQASPIRCRLDIPASTVVRIDVMDLSINSSLHQYDLILGNISNRRTFESGGAPTTLFWNNTRNTDLSTYMFFNFDQELSQNQYSAIFIRFVLYLSAINYDYSYAKKPVRLVYDSEDQSLITSPKIEVTPTTQENNETAVLDSSQKNLGGNDFNIVAVIVGATIGAMLLVLFVSIISVILGTRKRKHRKPPPTTDEELRYHVHANKVALNKMQAILENRENVSAMQQVKDLNNVIVSSSSSNFGTVDSRAPLETHIMAQDITAEDSAYDSSTEPVRSLEDLNFATNPRRANFQFQDNPLFFSLHRYYDGGPKLNRVHSSLIECSDPKYQNQDVFENSRPPRPKSAITVRDHEYVNDFIPRRPTRRKGVGQVRRSQSQHQGPGRSAKPKRTFSLYSTRVDYVKPPVKAENNPYYNTQPQPQLRKKPRRVQTIASADCDNTSTDDDARMLNANNNYSFHIMGSTQSLSDAVYNYPLSIDKHPAGLDKPRGLLFFSNNSIHAMLQEKTPVPFEELYALPQKKKKSGVFRLAGADPASADHEA